jgi:diacylglycerol O-acyltransferase-1
MKLISYAHTNRDLRLMTKAASETSGQLRSPHPSVRGGVEDDNAKPVNAFAEVADLEGPILRYPENITVSNLLYFMMVPTLCYQLNYPRSPRIRLKYVATILVRMALVAFLIIFFIEQYVSPTLTNAVQPFRDYDPLGILRLLLRLSITNTYIWLLGFYFYFHLYLNLFAELTRFGDRVFYKDWWNARTIDRYWRSWNLPVHHWMVRHVYYPLIRAGTGKTVAMFLVFLISAAFHEVVISVPFRTLTMHAFVGMLAQAPLSYLTKKLDKVFDNAMIGNSLFWIVFCIVGE